MKAEKEKLTKEQKETKKKIDGLEIKKEKQHEEIAKLQRENGLLEELNRNMNDLNKALEFPYFGNKEQKKIKDNKSATRTTHHRKSNGTKMKEECRNGAACEYLKQRRCIYGHYENRKTEKCRNGPSCQYLRGNRCWFEHNEDGTRGQTLKCRNGPECDYLKQNRCLYDHDEDVRKDEPSRHKDAPEHKKNQDTGRKERNKAEETNRNYENKRDENFLEQQRRNNNRKKSRDAIQHWANFY